MKSNYTPLTDVYIRSFKLKDKTWYVLFDLTKAFDITPGTVKRMIKNGEIKPYIKTMLDYNDKSRKERVVSHEDFFTLVMEGRNRMCLKFKEWVTKELISDYVSKVTPEMPGEEKDEETIIDFYNITHKNI